MSTDRDHKHKRAGHAARQRNAGPLAFERIARSGEARAGAITTPHGAIDTPAFMPVGTHGAVKAMTPDQVRETGSQIVLANTYHLALRPGEALVARFGGLHEYWTYYCLNRGVLFIPFFNMIITSPYHSNENCERVVQLWDEVITNLFDR